MTHRMSHGIFKEMGQTTIMLLTGDMPRMTKDSAAFHEDDFSSLAAIGRYLILEGCLDQKLQA